MVLSINQKRSSLNRFLWRFLQRRSDPFETRVYMASALRWLRPYFYENLCRSGKNW